MDLKETLEFLGPHVDVAFDANQYYLVTESDNKRCLKKQYMPKESNDNQNSNFMKVLNNYHTSEDENKDIRAATHGYKDNNDLVKRSIADACADNELSSDVSEERVTYIVKESKSSEVKPIADVEKDSNEEFGKKSGKNYPLEGPKSYNAEMNAVSKLTQDVGIEEKDIYLEIREKSKIIEKEEINKKYEHGLKQNEERSSSEIPTRISSSENSYCVTCGSRIRNSEKFSVVSERQFEDQQKQDTLDSTHEKFSAEKRCKIDVVGTEMNDTERIEGVENYATRENNLYTTGDNLYSKELAPTDNSHCITRLLVNVSKEGIKASKGVANNYLSLGGRPKEQRSYDVPVAHSSKLTSSSIDRKSDHSKRIQKSETSCSNIKTLEDALSYFGLSSHLLKLETSLEDLRKRKKSKEEHESYLKQLDKEMQKLSFNFHPDRVKNRGGTEEDIAEAQKKQTALNATRAVLNMLNETLMEDLNTDHKYGFYTKLNISSLGDEDKIKSHMYDVFFKIGLISEIKQQNIIAEIRKFLNDSKKCVHSYFLCDSSNFEKYRDSALFHLKCCVKGYKKLRIEYETIEEECKYEKLDNIYSLVRKMASESSRELTHLRLLKKAAKKSLSGRYQFFNPCEPVDKYFVLPFLYYTNVILMCNVMMKNTSLLESILSYLSTDVKLDPKYNEELCHLIVPYYLASYCSGNKQHTHTVFQIMGKGHLYQSRQATKYELNRDEIKGVFYSVLFETDKKMEPKFNVDDYIEGRINTKDHVTEELKKCMKLMTDFQKKEQELSNDIKKFKKKTREMDEKYDKVMKENEEFNKKVMERLVQSKELIEKISTALSEQP